MLEVNKTWSEGDTLRFIRSHFHFLSQYKDSVFDGIDGRVLIGITDANIGNILPELVPKHMSMFVTKLGTFMTIEASSSSKLLSKERELSRMPSARSVEDMEPRVLIEVWRDGVFCGEAWLPSILTLNHRDPQDINLQLRRTWSPEEIVTSGYIPRKSIIFGVLRVKARFSPTLVIASSIQEAGGGSLHMTIVDCSQFTCAIAGRFTFKLFVLPPLEVSETIRLVFESDSVLTEGGDCAFWDQQVTLEFLAVEDWKLKANMSSKGAQGGTPNISTLRGWALSREWFKFSPRYNRYDAELFPIHEPCAISGKRFILNAPEDVTRVNFDHLVEAVDLVLMSWGVDSRGNPLPIFDEGQKWTGHSWRLRHLLLCCIIHSHKQGISSLIRLSNSLKSPRRLNFDEDGSGEASFTLGAAKGDEWYASSSRTVPRTWQDQGFPAPWLTISQLIEIGKIRLN